MKLTEAQRRILEGLRYGNFVPISATEYCEREQLSAAGLVTIIDLEAESGAGQKWWFDAWRITEAGLAALAARGGE